MYKKLSSMIQGLQHNQLYALVQTPDPGFALFVLCYAARMGSGLNKPAMALIPSNAWQRRRPALKNSNFHYKLQKDISF